VIAIERKIFRGEVGRIYKNIGFAERFPIFADYNVLQSQPAWWLDTLNNYYKAVDDVEKAKSKLD
jgi:hypothetical protein